VLHSYEGLDRPGAFSRVRLLSPLRHRDFRLLWGGMCVSLTGDGIFLVALAWQVYELSNLPAALSLVGIAMTVPTIAFLLLGGALSDRMDRRRLMLTSDLIRGVAVGLLAVGSLTGMLELWHVAAIVAVYGTGAAFFGPAFDALVPELLPPEELAQANSLDQFVRPIALRLAGPAVGGVLIETAGTGWAFAIDASTFLASALAVATMRPGTRPAAAAAAGVAGDIRAGLRFVRSHAWLWGTFAAAAIAYLLFMGPTEVLLTYLVKNELGGSAAELGLVFAAGGIGSVACAILVGQGGLPRKDVTFMYLTWTVATLAVAGYGLATSIWQLMLASFAFNALETAGTIAWATMKQRHVPSALLGRVSSLDWLISIGLLPLSFALTGPVSGLLGVRETLVAAGVLGAVVTLAALWLPGMRAVEGLLSPRMAGTYDPGTDVVRLATEAAGTGVRALPRSWGGVEVDAEDRVLCAWYTRASERLPASYLAGLPAPETAAAAVPVAPAPAPAPVP
jgi:DHA3 family tetracycline resistance protein-like MFS transporter